LAYITFTVSFDSSKLPQEKIDAVKTYMGEYCGIGAFTDDFNPLLNESYNLYCYSVDSGPDFFKYWVAKGWSSPYNKKFLDLTKE
jgi:hypothetical protein